MSDELVKLEWRINSDTYAEAHPPFVIYIVQKVPSRGWQWTLFDGYYDEDSHSCEDMAEGMLLAEKHWRDSVQPITKPLTDRIEELEAKQKKAAQYFTKIILHCANSGRGVPLIDERIIERCEDIAVNAIEELAGGKDE